MTQTAPKQVCSHPEHHVHDPGSLLAEVAEVCRERGVRLTALRLQVLRLIAGSSTPVKAYELLELMRDTHGPTAPPTVYRALDFLLENGFIHKLESIAAFVSCHHPRQSHSAPFLICSRCQVAIELEDEQVTRLLSERAAALGFHPQAQTLEVHGICARCSKAE
jgi:Fur family zinc uptake transcriptional regulator